MYPIVYSTKYPTNTATPPIVLDHWVAPNNVSLNILIPTGATFSSGGCIAQYTFDVIDPSTWLGSANTLTTSGTGSVATVTFNNNYTVPVGSSVTISGVTPSDYNGTFIVTASSPGSVSFSSTATGSQTVQGTIGTTANWFDHPSLGAVTPITTTTDANLAYPATAVRMIQTGGTDVACSFTVIQAGVGV